MVGDELDHRGDVLRRSSSAWAKDANAFRRISFARFSSRTSRSSSFNRSRSLVVRPGRCPASRCACRTHCRSVSAVQPSFGTTDCSTAHSEAWASRCSSTIRTARSRTSGENRLGRPIDPILPSNEVSEKPGTIHGEGLTALEQRLDQAEELGRAVGKQHETLLHGRKELDALRKELDEFYRTQAEVAKSREQIGADRTAFQGFLQRVDEFRRHILELDSRMDAISEKLSIVDEGMQKAATLVAIADDLDNQMTRIAAHQQLLEKINTRLNSLNSLSVSVDKRLEEQIARRQEAEALKNQCDGLGVQIGDAQQKMQEVTGLQQKLMPLFTQVASLKTQTDKVAATFKESQHDAAELAAQEVRMTELADRSREVATAVDERLKQVQGVSEELGRAAGIKDELAEELGRVQARQRDVTTHVKTSEEQLVRVDQQLEQLNQRHSQLSFADKKIATFEERLSDLKTLSDNVERQIQTLATREAFVGSVKKSVDEVHQISQRSRADLQHVVDHRTQVDALGAQFEAALKSVGKTEERMAVIEGRKKLVDEVQLETNLIVNVLEDVRVNLEILTEQRAVVDHVVESMARVRETEQRAEATLKSLQAERQLAERIERGIKLLRTKIAKTGDDTRPATAG